MENIISRPVAAENINGQLIADVEFSERFYCLEIDCKGLLDAETILAVAKLVVGNRENILININALTIDSPKEASDNFLLRLIQGLYANHVPFGITVSVRQDIMDPEFSEWKKFLKGIKSEIFDLSIKSDVWVQRIASLREAGLTK